MYKSPRAVCVHEFNLIQSVPYNFVLNDPSVLQADLKTHGMNEGEKRQKREGGRQRRKKTAENNDAHQQQQQKKYT